MNKHSLLLLLTASAVALLAIGCGDSGMMTVDAGGHPDLGNRDLGSDTGTPDDLGVDMTMPPVDGGVDMTMPPTDGGTDAGPVDMGTFLTDAGCWEGVPMTMPQFLNHCTTRSTPAAVTGSGFHSTLIGADGSVPSIP